MSRSGSPTSALFPKNGSGQLALDAQRIFSELNLDSIPFSAHDITAGSENELQAAVAGHTDHVDLPIVIESSNYMKNILRRAATGESPKQLIANLEAYLRSHASNVWENSWVRLPVSTLTPFALNLLRRDMTEDKRDACGAPRKDVSRFFFPTKARLAASASQLPAETRPGAGH